MELIMFRPEPSDRHKNCPLELIKLMFETIVKKEIIQKNLKPSQCLTSQHMIALHLFVAKITVHEQVGL